MKNKNVLKIVGKIEELNMLQKCPHCGELIFYREKGHSKEDRCDLRKKEEIK